MDKNAMNSIIWYGRSWVNKETFRKSFESMLKGAEKNKQTNIPCGSGNLTSIITFSSAKTLYPRWLILALKVIHNGKKTTGLLFCV